MMPDKYNPYANEIRCLNCREADLCIEWNNFVEKQSDSNTRAKYAHFDSRRYLNDSKVLKKVMNPNYVKSHGFYPLIQYNAKHTSYFRPKKRIEGERVKGKRIPKDRFIAYCGYLDRAIYQRYSFILNYQYNNKIEEMGIAHVPIAYRTNLKGKSNIHFAKEAFDFISNQEKAYIFVSDFSGFFDRLNHEYLKKMMCKVLDVKYLPDDIYAIYKNITKYSVWEWKDLLKINHLDRTEGATTKMNQKARIITRNEFRKNSHLIKTNAQVNEHGIDCGIPQGTPISATLSNIYMLDFDQLVNNVVKKLGGKYMRYSDDLIIIIPGVSERQIIEIKEFTLDLVKKIDKETKDSVGLKINEKKTQEYLFDGEYIRNIKDNKIVFLDYLGFIFNGKKIKIRRKSITKYYYRMYKKAKTIRESDGTTYKGNPISANNLYETYSEKRSGPNRNFIDYIKDADNILGLDDAQAKSLIENHMEKIAKAIRGTEPNNYKSNRNS